jgi:hypothetical protein
VEVVDADHRRVNQVRLRYTSSPQATGDEGAGKGVTDHGEDGS